MDILPPHPAPPSSGGVPATSPPPRPNTITPPHLPPVPAVAPSGAPSGDIAVPSAMASSAPSAPSAPSASPDDRSTAFHSVDATPDQGLGTTLLVEAYAAIWIIMMGFVLLGWRKQGALNVRLDDLEKAIDKSEAAKKMNAEKV